MGASGTDPYSRNAGAATDATLRVVQATDSPLPTGSATAAGQASQLAKTPALGVIGTPSADVVSVQGFGYSAAVGFTRTADTNAYAALDVIGINAAGSPGSAIHTIPLIGPAGGNIIITGVQLEIDIASIPAGMDAFRLHLYDASPASILDNAAFDLGSTGADRAKYLGFITLAAPVDLGSTIWSESATPPNKPVKLAAASTSLYGVLQTVAGYTPASASVFSLRMQAIAA